MNPVFLVGTNQRLNGRVKEKYEEGKKRIKSDIKIHVHIKTKLKFTARLAGPGQACVCIKEESENPTQENRETKIFVPIFKFLGPFNVNEPLLASPNASRYSRGKIICPRDDEREMLGRDAEKYDV